MSNVTKNANNILKIVQNFDVDSLARTDDLGNRFSFADIVQYAKKSQDLYKQLPLEAVDILPDEQAETIHSLATETHRKWSEIMEFDPTDEAGNPVGHREELMMYVREDYASIFAGLHPLISYGLAIVSDPQQQVANLDQMRQKAEKDIEDFNSVMKDALSAKDEILNDMRQAAAEQGVSQQAIHFSSESESHNKQADHWKWATGIFAGLLAIYSGIILFASDKIGAGTEIQIALGKVLLFAVLSYAVFLSARNFMSHTHNAIVNKHRQNALMTFKTLADATQDESTRDVILSHASTCIFSPQNTGYTKSDGKSPTTDPSAVGLVAKMMARE